MKSKKFYITTAIAYPNGKPHLGHALEIIQADVLARFHRLLGKDVWFQTGTDEHGVKNWETAQKEGKDILEFLDAHVAVFKELYKKLKISNDYFIRTSDKKVHYPKAQKLWEALVKAGDIYKKKYKGLYCAGCEAFKLDRELEDGKCPDHPTREIQTIEEENYFFKLSKYSQEVFKKIESDEYQVIPEVRKHEILSFLKEAKDISFSRTKEALPWGIPVPHDEEHVMYVWCDALSNYITGIDYSGKKFDTYWPADIHVIGKDILRFHAGFWPAMLMSAEIALPKQLFVHGFIMSKGAKMGKSTGNVIEPFGQLDKFGVDQFRFYILESMPMDGDGDYSEELFVERINSELVGNLSNFCYRVLSYTNKNFDGKIKDVDDDPIINDINSKVGEVKDAYEECNFRKAVDGVMAVSALGNKYFQEKEPWKLIKEDKDAVQKVLGLCVNIAKILCVISSPVMPSFSANLEKQLKLKKLTWDDVNFDLKNHNIGKHEIIFSKCEVEIGGSEEGIGDDVKELKMKVNPVVSKLGINALSVCIKGINVKKSQSGLEKLKKEYLKDIDFKENILKESESLYKQVGDAQPAAARKLIELIKKNGKIPTINTVVDSYNMVSAKYNVAMGCHDINKINTVPTLALCNGNEKFTELNTKNTVKVKKGIFSCLEGKRVMCYLDVKQGDETKIDENSSNVFLYVQGNKETPIEYLQKALDEAAANIIKFCGGEKIVEESSFPFELRVGEIKKAEQHPDAYKLYVLQVDFGKEKRQIISGLKGIYELNELEGRKVVAICNLKPSKIRGEMSNGMLVGGEVGEKYVLASPEKSKLGELCYFDKPAKEFKEVGFKDFENSGMKSLGKKIVLDNKKLKTNSEEISVDIEDGAKIY